MKQPFFRSLAVAAMLVCVGWSAASAQSLVRTEAGFQNVRADLTALGSAYLRDGAAVRQGSLHDVQPGLGREQVRQLLGQPVSTALTSRGEAWEYHLQVPLKDPRNALVCQYHVVFDTQADQLTETYWRRPQCRDLAGDTILLSSDFLFDFDSADLSRQGQSRLDALLDELRAGGRTVSLTVVGHADRLGGHDYNQALSERRALAVARYLAGRGVPPQALRAEGRGASQPVTQCEGTQATRSLQACLAPNRRVSIQVNPA